MKRLIAIQQALKVQKNKQGYGYTYRDAEQILEAAKPALDEQKCAVVCNAEYVTIADAVYKKVTATLYGEDGKAIASAYDMVKSPAAMKGMVEQQVSGSDTTYCKRYALQNLFAVDNAADDIDHPDNALNPKRPQNKPVAATKQAAQAVAPQATQSAPKTQENAPQVSIPSKLTFAQQEAQNAPQIKSPAQQAKEYLAGNNIALQYYMAKYPDCGELDHFTERQLREIYAELVKHNRIKPLSI